MDSLSNTTDFNASDALKELLELKEETRALREQRQQELSQQENPEEVVEAEPLLSERDQNLQLIQSKLNELKDSVAHIKDEEPVEEDTKTAILNKILKERKKLSLYGDKEEVKEIIEEVQDKNTEWYNNDPKRLMKEEVVEEVQEEVITEDVVVEEPKTYIDILGEKMSKAIKKKVEDPHYELTEAEEMFQNLQKQIAGVRQMVTEQTIVHNLGAGSTGSGEVNINRMDDVEITNPASNNHYPVSGQVLAWDDVDKKYKNLSVSGVGGDVSSIIGGIGIEADGTIGTGQGDVTINLDAVLDDLKDVTIGTEAVGQVIKYTGTEYENKYLETAELDLTNPTRIADLGKKLNRAISIPPNLKTQLDANQVFVNAFDSIDDQLVDIGVEIGDINDEIVLIKDDITDLAGRVGTNESNISAINKALDKKPDMEVSDTPPSPVPSKDGQFWYDDVNDTLYISDAGVWVEVAGGSGTGGAGVTVSDIEPTVNVKEGDLWITETEKYLYVYHNSAWEQAAYTPEYILKGKSSSTAGTAVIALEDEKQNEQELEIKGEGGIVASYSGNQIIIDGSNIVSGKNLLGQISAVTDDLTTIEQNPNEGDYYEFYEGGDWLGSEPVNVNDELHWDHVNLLWEVKTLPSPNLDQVLKSGNQSDEDAEIKNLILNGDNNGDGEITFPGASNNYVKLRAGYEPSQSNLGRTRLYMDSWTGSQNIEHLVLTEKNICYTILEGTTLTTNSATYGLHTLEMRDVGLFYDNELIDTHGQTDLNDLADVQLNDPRQVHSFATVAYDDYTLANTCGAYKIDSRFKNITYARDESCGSVEDLYNATTVNDTYHYIANKPGGPGEFGTSSLVIGKFTDSDINGNDVYVFNYQDSDYIATAYTEHRVGIVDPPTDGDVLTYVAADGLWHARQPKVNDGLSGAHELNDLHDVETFDETFQSVYNASIDPTSQGGFEAIVPDKKVVINKTDTTGTSSQDLYDNTTVGSTVHYFSDNNSPAAGVCKVINKEVDSDGNFVFIYEFVGFVTNLSLATGAFEFGIADFTNLQDGQALVWDANKQLWVNGDAAGGADVVISDNQPIDVPEGTLWFNSNEDQLTLYINYGDTANPVWAPAAPPVSLDGITTAISDALVVQEQILTRLDSGETLQTSLSGKISDLESAAGDYLEKDAVNKVTTNFRISSETKTFISTNNNQLGLYNLVDPTNDAHAVNRGYADGRYLKKTGGTLTGNLTFNGGSRIDANTGNQVLTDRACLEIRASADLPIAISSGSSFKPMLAFYGYDGSQPDNKGKVAEIKANGNAYFTNVYAENEKLATQAYVDERIPEPLPALHLHSKSNIDPKNASNPTQGQIVGYYENNPGDGSKAPNLYIGNWNHSVRVWIADLQTVGTLPSDGTGEAHRGIFEMYTSSGDKLLHKAVVDTISRSGDVLTLHFEGGRNLFGNSDTNAQTSVRYMFYSL